MRARITIASALALTLGLYLGSCIVRADYYPVYPNEDIPARRVMIDAPTVYQSTQQIGRNYYVIGLVQTRGNAYAKWGSHKRKLQQVAREHHGDAVIVFSSRSELISIYNYANVSGYGGNIYGYGGSIPIRGLTTGAAIIRFNSLDTEEGILPPASRALMRSFEIDEESVARLEIARVQWTVFDSTTWVAGEPRAEFEYGAGENVDLKLCRVAGLNGLITLVAFYQKNTVKQPETAEVLYRCGEYRGRAEMIGSESLELFIVHENGTVAWQKKVGGPT